MQAMPLPVFNHNHNNHIIPQLPLCTLHSAIQYGLLKRFSDLLHHNTPKRCKYFIKRASLSVGLIVNSRFFVY